VPTVVVAAEHYGRIARTLQKGVPVTLELTARSTFHDGEVGSFNLLAELPGRDPRLRDEVVMVGAHLDSWHGGTGATDNAAGVAVMMEAMRILAASRVRLARTVRIALWTGEEQGLLGSRAYVAAHFGDREARAWTPAHERFSVYLNLDNGTGRIRGVYQQGNAAVGPILDAWMAPFAAGGMRTRTLANTTGTDHLSFDAVGLPAFQFIQDPVEYGGRTYHTSMDVYERLQADDLRWNALVVATFAMQAANRPAKLPRKPAPATPAAPAQESGLPPVTPMTSPVM
jgi:Zn-dependent M28 family amino/carboxypeptidase